jgi:hypothetical protein
MVKEIRQKKLHKKAPYHLYSVSNIITLIKSGRMRCRMIVTSTGQMRYARNILARKFEGKRSYVKPKHREKDNINDDLGMWAEMKWR